ncbi:Uncharacterised protein [Klebsiella pneumoniae]|nr:Uncharacterised protein [Klebsiella pneumoniae]SBY00139.1 Uncharacterised protein [Klebsiella pneumoniae]SBY41800.1 Uncharacterised protein [Klebsiella pneumoniae]SBY47561.1 Uncharacterised protein [Klebsiella pneumoniae]
MNNQQTMLYQGVLIPRPVLNVDLHVLPDFTGRVVVHIENGRVICDRQLFDDEHGHVYRNGPRRGVEDRGGSWWH